MRVLIPFASQVTVPADDTGHVLMNLRSFSSQALVVVVVNCGDPNSGPTARAAVDMSEDLTRAEGQQLEDIPPGQQRSLYLNNYGSQVRVRSWGVGAPASVKFLVRGS